MNGIEHIWIHPERAHRPLVVFLHEGLGSVALWRDFPKRFCDAMQMRGLVFSRKGYGQSTPREPHEHWSADFMHTQAIDFLPAFLESQGIDTEREPPILFGHSDGATIALIYAATYPERIRGLMVLAPHIVIEDITIESIKQGKITYETPSTQLKTKLSRYHADVDSAFYGWCDVWLSNSFQSFDIRALLKCITCPVLAVQGQNDVYGTMAQIDEIAQQAPQTQLLKLANCGHSPHIDQPEALLAGCKQWAAAHGGL